MKINRSKDVKIVEMSDIKGNCGNLFETME